jgi:excisionase family DNA binding protein
VPQDATEKIMDQIVSNPAILPRLSYTPDEAATATGFSRTRIFNAIRDRELTARKDGKATVIESAELVRWLRSLPTRGRTPEPADVAA